MAFCDDPAHHWVRASWDGHGARPALPDDDVRAGGRDEAARSGIGVVGFGWMGQAHSRSLPAHPDALPGPRRRSRACRVRRRRRAPGGGTPIEGFGFREATDDWRKVVERPRRRHRRRHGAEHAPRRDRLGRRGGRQGGVLREARRRHAGPDRGRRAGRPPRRHGRRLQLPLGAARAVRPSTRRRRAARADHELPRPVPVVLRQRPARPAVAGASSSTRAATASDRSAQPRGRPRAAPRRPDQPTSSASARRSSGSGPLPATGGSHYDRGAPGDATGAGHQRGLVRRRGPLRRRRGRHVRGLALDGRAGEPDTRFEIYGTAGSVRWNLERMNELEVYLADDERTPGTRRVFGGDRFAEHGAFVPGRANPIGFEDLVTIEDHHFAAAVAEGRPFDPGFAAAVGVRRACRTRCCGRGSPGVGERRDLRGARDDGADGPPDDGRGDRALPDRPAHRHRRRRGAARARGVRHLRSRQRDVPRAGAARRRRRAADVAGPERAGDGARRRSPTPRRCGAASSWSPPARSVRAR